jgi:hypothetical protein
MASPKASSAPSGSTVGGLRGHQVLVVVGALGRDAQDAARLGDGGAHGIQPGAIRGCQLGARHFLIGKTRQLRQHRLFDLAGRGLAA